MATRLPDELIGARRIEPSAALAKAVSDAIDAVYGSGYSYQARSGGVHPGQAGSSSGRHVADKQGDKTATDWKIYDPSGKQLAGAVLKPFAQHWVANYGSIGVNAKPGDRGPNFTHLDLVRRDAANQRVWFYGDPGFKREEVTAHVGKGQHYAAWADPKTASGKAAPATLPAPQMVAGIDRGGHKLLTGADPQLPEAMKPTSPLAFAGLDPSARGLLASGALPAQGQFAPAAVAAKEQAGGLPITQVSLQPPVPKRESVPQGPFGFDRLVEAVRTGDPAKIKEAYQASRDKVWGAMTDQEQLLATGSFGKVIPARITEAQTNYFGSYDKKTKQFTPGIISTQSPGVVREIGKLISANPTLLDDINKDAKTAIEAAYKALPAEQPKAAPATAPVAQPYSPVAMPGGTPPADDRPPPPLLMPEPSREPRPFGPVADAYQSREPRAFGPVADQYPAREPRAFGPVTDALPMTGSASIGAGNSMPPLSAAPRLVDQSREPRPFGPVADPAMAREQFNERFALPDGAPFGMTPRSWTDEEIIRDINAITPRDHAVWNYGDAIFDIGGIGSDSRFGTRENYTSWPIQPGEYAPPFFPEPKSAGIGSDYAQSRTGGLPRPSYDTPQRQITQQEFNERFDPAPFSIGGYGGVSHSDLARFGISEPELYSDIGKAWEPQPFGFGAVAPPTHYPTGNSPISPELGITEYRVPDVVRASPGGEWASAQRSQDAVVQPVNDWVRPSMGGSSRPETVNDWTRPSMAGAARAAQVNEWASPAIEDIGEYAAAPRPSPAPFGYDVPIDDLAMFGLSDPDMFSSIGKTLGIPTVKPPEPEPVRQKPTQVAQPAPMSLAPRAPTQRRAGSGPIGRGSNNFNLAAQQAKAGGGGLLGGLFSGAANIFGNSVLSPSAPLNNVTQHAANFNPISGGSQTSYQTGTNSAGQHVTSDGWGNTWINNPDGTSTMLY